MVIGGMSAESRSRGPRGPRLDTAQYRIRGFANMAARTAGVLPHIPRIVLSGRLVGSILVDTSTSRRHDGALKAQYNNIHHVRMLPAACIFPYVILALRISAPELERLSR